MKAVISNRIYMEVIPSQRDDLGEKLTHRIPAQNKYDPPTIIRMMTRVKDNIVSIPSGRLDLVPEDYEIKDKRVLAPVTFPDFPNNFLLRPSQAEIYDAVTDSCIINAKVAWGKTFMGLCLAKKLGQKTLVVVHNTGLRDQWIKEIKKLYGFEAGVIGSGKFNLSAPIVVGNTQTLYNVLPQVSKEFGTLIVDEVHHTPANTFSRIVDSSYARYRIGLSGTVNRKDGKHVLINDYFGSTRYTPARENYMPPKVHVIRAPIQFPDSNVAWALKINGLAELVPYQELVVSLTKHYIRAGHKVLVVSDRVKFLTECMQYMDDDAILVLGQTDSSVRDTLDTEITKKGAIFASQQIFSEGISVNQLGVIILATPINNEPLLEQLIGRVTRLHPDKKQPIVVDLWLKGRIASNQAKQRLGHYLRQGYEISYF